MKNNYNHYDFEEFLQNQLKNHRIYPTDSVWRNAGREFLIAAPPNDESVGAVAEQHGVTVTLLKRMPGFDLYSGRPSRLSPPGDR